MTFTTMKLFAALSEDSHQGWVWLRDSSLPPRCIVKITNPINGKTIYCEALQIDSNFLRNYNQSPRVSITDPQSSLVMGSWYRAKLGGLPIQQEVSLSIKPCNSWRGRFIACVHHPQTVVRLAAWLGFISIVLGLAGAGLGAVSLWPTKPNITGESSATVFVPAGEFWMGSEKYHSEKPRRRVYLDAFYIDKYEVTNALYQQFMHSTGHIAPYFWNDSRVNKPNQPVVGVNWHDALAYCKWAGKRLPTEAEWEMVAYSRAFLAAKTSRDKFQALRFHSWLKACWEF